MNEKPNRMLRVEDNMKIEENKLALKSGDIVTYISQHTIEDVRITNLEKKVERLLNALKEIREGKGRYDPNNYKHATNTIEDMKELADIAIKEEAMENENDSTYTV